MSHFRISILVSLFLGVTSISHADSCLVDALRALQREELVLSQNSSLLHHPDNACGQVCAVNLFQVLSTRLELDTSLNPIEEANSLTQWLKEIGADVKSGLTSEQIALAVHEVFAKNHPGIEVTTELRGILTDVHQSIEAADLIPTHYGNKTTASLVGITQIYKGKIVGSHEVLVVDVDLRAQTIHLLDPNHPNRTIKVKYDVTRLLWNDQPLGTLLIKPENEDVFGEAKGSSLVLGTLVRTTVTRKP